MIFERSTVDILPRSQRWHLLTFTSHCPSNPQLQAETLPSPRCAPEVSRLCDMTAKSRLLTRVGDPCTRTLTTQRQSKAIHQHKQIRLPSHLRILFLMVLISMVPNSYGGACVNTHANCRPFPVTLSFIRVFLKPA